MKYAKHLGEMNFLNSSSLGKKKGGGFYEIPPQPPTPLFSLLWGFALTLNCSYRPVQICGGDTCHVLERIEEEAEETRERDLGL